MKKLLTILSLLLCLGAVPALAQKGRFTVFSEDGDKFFLVADGKRINTTADFRVEAKDIPGTRIRVKIVFQDPKKPAIDDVVYVKDAENKYVYVTYVIRKKKDRYVLRWSDVDEAPNIPEWTASHQDDEPAQKPTKKPAPKPATPNDPSTDAPGEVNITMPGVTIKTSETGFNMDVKDPEMTHTTTTTTTTRRTTTRNNGQVTTRTAPAEEVEEAPAPKAAAKSAKPMTAQAYSSLLANIKRQGFDDSKVKMAKLAFKNNALSTKQISEILKLISFEQSRLDLAKEGYANCLDKENYLNISEVFSFSSSTDELTEFLGNQ